MIGILFIIKVSDTSYKGTMTSFLCPLNRFFLSLEGAEHLVRLVFDYITLNGGSLRAALRTSFYIHISHVLLHLIMTVLFATRLLAG